MKKVFSCVLVALMLLSVLALSVGAVWDGTDKYHDFGTIGTVERKTIRLDGEREVAYDTATPIIIATPSAADKVTLTNGVAYMVYDTQYIWVFVEVNDLTLNTKADGPLLSGYKQDSVEVVFDFDNSGKGEKNVSPYQSRLTHEGYISGRVGNGGTALYGTSEQGSDSPVFFLDGFAKHREDETGYNCEFRIEPPFDKFTIGERIGLSLIINDYDENGANRIILNSNTTDPTVGVNWQVDQFGSIVFDYKAAYTADMTIIYVAIAMAAALVIGTVTVISLKKKAK